MFEATQSPRVFGVSPGSNYPKALADGLISRFSGHPPEGDKMDLGDFNGGTALAEGLSILDPGLLEESVLTVSMSKRASAD